MRLRNKEKIKPMFIASAIGVLMVTGTIEAASKLYRYKNAEGTLVIEDRIPPENVSKGYEILNRQGRILMTVPAKTQKESDTDDAELALQQAKDQFLLRSFSRVEEIESTRTRKLSLFEREISIIEKNIININQHKQNVEEQAASRQRSGQKVSNELLQELNSLGRQAEESKAMLVLRQQEVDDLNARYNAYIERFKVLRSTLDQ